MHSRTRQHFFLFVTLFLLLGMLGTVQAQKPVTPIPTEKSDKTAVAFVGAPAIAKTIIAPTIPANPGMADNDRSNVHDDTYMSDTYVVAGPLGKQPSTLSAFLDGNCISMAFDKQGRIVTTCLGLKKAVLYLLDPKSLAILASLSLPDHKTASPGTIPPGSYFYLDANDNVILPTTSETDPENKAEIWSVSIVGNPPKFEKSGTVPIDISNGDSMSSVLPDFSGNQWFVTKNGVVGVNTPNAKVYKYNLNSGTAIVEQITNSFAIDETGGVFIASDHAMYRFDLDSSGAPVPTWREPYYRGTRQKPGQFAQGTGTTPTLMGKDYVTITDNADPTMHVLVYRRGKQSDLKSRLICTEDVFTSASGQSDTENSLIATDKSIIVENNYGYENIDSTRKGKTTIAGLARIDLDSNTGCHTVWSKQVYVPNVVSKMSLGSGLIYTYTKDPNPASAPNAWYFTAVDFQTGDVVYKQLVGTGAGYDSHYAGLYLSPDGTAYVGTSVGIVSIRDGK